MLIANESETRPRLQPTPFFLYIFLKTTRRTEKAAASALAAFCHHRSPCAAARFPWQFFSLFWLFGGEVRDKTPPPSRRADFYPSSLVHRAPVGQELRLPRLATTLGFSFGLLVWADACYWHGVGGAMFNSPSSRDARISCFRRRSLGDCDHRGVRLCFFTNHRRRFKS